MSEKITLSLDSQALTSYQQCPKHYWFAHRMHLESLDKGKALNFGTIVHELFDFVNKGILQGESVGSLIFPAFDAQKEALDKLPTEEKTFLMKRFVEYFSHWKIEDSRYKLISAEDGFSKVIFENDHVLFVYEGRIDALYYNTRENCYVWRDYKTSSGRSIYTHNNQFLGYTWALGDRTSRGEIDYIGKQATKTERTFQREIVKFHESQIERWVERTKRTFFQILNDIEFHENQSACDTKFGVCIFHKLCERDPAIHPQMIQISYKVREKQWSAWE